MEGFDWSKFLFEAIATVSPITLSGGLRNFNNSWGDTPWGTVSLHRVDSHIATG